LIGGGEGRDVGRLHYVFNNDTSRAERHRVVGPIDGDDSLSASLPRRPNSDSCERIIEVTNDELKLDRGTLSIVGRRECKTSDWSQETWWL
jgi:hypothetical protein